MTPVQAYDFILLALCIWREARGEALNTKNAVAWSIRNRVLNPGWWGTGWSGIILQPFQYSSFNRSDPNATKLPMQTDPSWQDSLIAAQQVYSSDPATAPAIADPTNGATSYFDMSLDLNPPSWATDGSFVKTADIGRLHFYRKA
jgi:spore germination cell wall hydrolase CwlJ-like protein